MRDNVSILNRSTEFGRYARTRIGARAPARLTVVGVEAESPGERELRDRLNYWIRWGMFRERMSEAELARLIGTPATTLNRWLHPDEKAVVDIRRLGPICRALHIDPMVFALLPPIPADPLNEYPMPAALDLLTVTDATRLAQLDSVPGEELDPPAVVAPGGQPRKPRRSGARRCPPG